MVVPLSLGQKESVGVSVRGSKIQRKKRGVSWLCTDTVTVTETKEEEEE
jgi:hypothetical protein